MELEKEKQKKLFGEEETKNFGTEEKIREFEEWAEKEWGWKISELRKKGGGKNEG